MYLIHFVLEIKNCHKIIQSCLILTFGAQLQIVFKSFSTNFQTFQCSNKKFRRGYKIVSSARWTKGQGDSNIPPIFCLQEFNTIHTHAYIQVLTFCRLSENIFQSFNYIRRVFANLWSPKKQDYIYNRALPCVCFYQCVTSFNVVAKVCKICERLKSSIQNVF